MVEEGAMVSVLGAVVAILVAAALGAAVYAALASPGDQEDPVPAISLVGSRTECGMEFVVAGVQEGVLWNDVALRLDGATQYTLSAQNVSVTGQRWQGAALAEARPLAQGDLIALRIAEGGASASLVVLHRETVSAMVPLGGPLEAPGRCDA